MFDILYTIRTEWSETYQRNVEDVMNALFGSYNISRGTGYWKGKREDSMTIEIIGRSDITYVNKVNLAAETITKVNNQEAVFVTVQPIQGVILYKQTEAK